MSIIVIPAAQQVAANTATGEPTFTVPLYTGQNVTHYWCGWDPPAGILAALEALGGTVHPADPDAVLADLGLSREPAAETAAAILAAGAAELDALPAPTTPADLTSTVADILTRAAQALNGGA